MEVIALGFIALVAAALFIRLMQALGTWLARTISSTDPKWRMGVEDNIMRREVNRKYGPDTLRDEEAIAASALKVQMSAPGCLSTMAIAFFVFIVIIFVTNPPGRIDASALDIVVPFLVVLLGTWVVRRVMWRLAWNREVSAFLKARNGEVDSEGDGPNIIRVAAIVIFALLIFVMVLNSLATIVK